MNGTPSLGLTWFEWAEVLSCVVTIFGFPLAILVFVYEQRKERRGEDVDFAAYIRRVAAVGAALATVTPRDCHGFFVHAGYAA